MLSAAQDAAGPGELQPGHNCLQESTVELPAAAAAEHMSIGQQQQDEAQQQLVAAAWLSGASNHNQQPQPGSTLREAVTAAAGRPESPSWWLKASAAGFRVQPGPIQIESSLYSTWANTFTAADPATAAGRIVSAPAASAAAATTKLGRGLCRTLGTPGSSSPPPLQEGDELPAAARGRAQTAAAAAGGAARTCSSPCSSNFCSSRAAGIAAGISKPGMSPKHQAWLKVQYPGAKPPGRGDVESVQLWLQQQLQSLIDSHATADSSNEQRLQQPAQRILASAQPEYLLFQQQQQHAGDSSPAADAAAGEYEWLDSTGLQAQTSQLLSGARQPAGPLDVPRLQQQEALYSAAFNELCR